MLTFSTYLLCSPPVLTSCARLLAYVRVADSSRLPLNFQPPFLHPERLHISTPNKYEFQYVQRPQRLTRFDVAVRAHNDARVALSSGPQDTAGMIEIVLGGHQNTRSWIATSKMGEPVASAHTAKILSWDEFRTFWVSWRDGLVQVGHGPEPSNESVIMAWTLPRPPEVPFIGFSTGWGSVGEFRIWRKMEVDESYGEAFTLGVPRGAIPGSERAAASLTGDVMGPTLNHLNKLLRLPFGCGEQNMIHFAPNVFVLRYLQKTQQLSPEVERDTTDYLVQGYQRQLTYRHQDGSYSAFGERDTSGSMWLTAFVLKSFAQARSFIFIDPQELAAAKGWIIQQQGADGAFPVVGRILNKDIQGGIHGAVPLTAYVVAALLETGTVSEEERAAVAKARRFLESRGPLATDPYSHALTAYALTLLRSPAAPEALRKLRSLAITQVVSAEVEMTAYALLTYTLLGDVAAALPAVKWLSQQRNALGGFSSTQDTCVALQALAEYAILSYAGGVNLTVSLASTNLDYQETFTLHRANRKVLQTAAIPSLPTGLFVSARGDGCCLLQIDVTYHVPDPVTKPAFQLLVRLEEPEAEGRPSPVPASSAGGPRGGEQHLADDDDPAADQHHQEYKVRPLARPKLPRGRRAACPQGPSGSRLPPGQCSGTVFDKKPYEVAHWSPPDTPAPGPLVSDGEPGTQPRWTLTLRDEGGHPEGLGAQRWVDDEWLPWYLTRWPKRPGSGSSYIFCSTVRLGMQAGQGVKLDQTQQPGPQPCWGRLGCSLRRVRKVPLWATQV
ncbi:Hypothetical predicted protein [Marmota monax]|uniref:Alpha-macroglobulin receptor-binding domain-containing protein n=1 Tax=Marmota monax TaxID=9995 RepID=A0A5E4BU32_MARMO|nr:hypothetical protein GHT09_010515 [Marmota monax]VTJ73117.1 Hypothetical predicted protein [Marmota monax]